MSGLLKSVLTLHAANWGRTVSPQVSVPSSPAANTFTQEPVFYSASGQRITREEAGYGKCNSSCSALAVMYSCRQNIYSLVI